MCPRRDKRKVLILRMALSQLSFTTDTGGERGLIAEMLAALEKDGCCCAPPAAPPARLP